MVMEKRRKFLDLLNIKPKMVGCLNSFDCDIKATCKGVNCPTYAPNSVKLFDFSSYNNFKLLYVWYNNNINSGTVFEDIDSIIISILYYFEHEDFDVKLLNELMYLDYDFN